MGSDAEFDASNDILTIPKTGLGEEAKAMAKAGMPGPFSAVPAASIATAGYTVHMNKYDNVDTTVGLDCGGDLNGGKVQSYDKDAKPPDLTKCNKKCNKSATTMQQRLQHTCNKSAPHVQQKRNKRLPNLQRYPQQKCNKIRNKSATKSDQSATKVK